MGGAAAAARERVSRLVREVELECGDISASQEGLLASAPFLGGGGEEPEVFSTPPLTHRQEEEEAVTMCSVPFTQPSPSPGSSPPDKEESDSRPRKPRVCTRKVRGAKIRTPTPSPDPRPSSSRSGVVDPLYKAVLMIPTKPPRYTGAEDILVLARQRGIF